MNKHKVGLLLGTQYLNASGQIFLGLRQQHKDNPLHFLISLRSFIEYTRRGIWFLCWADQEKLKEAERLTFENPGSPSVEKMDEMLNVALGGPEKSALSQVIPVINEKFIDCLHALTHGNPISVRLLTHGLEKTFNVPELLSRAEVDLNIFTVLQCRKLLGEKQKDIFKRLRPIHNSPPQMKACAQEAAFLWKQSRKKDADS
jgi:hypothetical protein